MIGYGKERDDFVRRCSWENLPDSTDFIEWCADGLSIVTDPKDNVKYLYIDAEGGYAGTMLNVEKLKEFLNKL